MTRIDIVELARAYYKGYRDTEIMMFRRGKGEDFDVPENFEQLPLSERDCIKMGLRDAVLVLQPDAKFTGLASDSELAF